MTTISAIARIREILANLRLSEAAFNILHPHGEDSAIDSYPGALITADSDHELTYKERLERDKQNAGLRHVD